MKKLFAILLGMLLSLAVIVAFKLHMDSEIEKNAAGLRNLRTYQRFWSSDVQRLIIEENTLPIFGSSELVSLNEYENEVSNFLNGDEINVVTIGAGNYQSLFHAIILGAIAEDIPSKKVALFLSPQWFKKSGVEGAAFSARFSENAFLDFLCNEKINEEYKRYVLDRTTELLSDSPTQLLRVQRYYNAFEHPISVDGLYMRIMNAFWDFRAEYQVYRNLNGINNDLPYYDLDSLDFSAILELAESQGQASCTNNDFGVYDSYWDTYIAPYYELRKGETEKQVYNVSTEYYDLACFLDIALEADIDVFLVNIPLNGRWADYIGECCDEYYNNIRDIAGQYSNVTLIDMSVYEDEMYFLKDVMHLGWKGWARINESLYTEFVEK